MNTDRLKAWAAAVITLCLLGAGALTYLNWPRIEPTLKAIVQVFGMGDRGGQGTQTLKDLPKKLDPTK